MWRARLKTKRAKRIVIGVSTFYIIEGGVLICLLAGW